MRRFCDLPPHCLRRKWRGYKTRENLSRASEGVEQRQRRLIPSHGTNSLATKLDWQRTDERSLRRYSRGRGGGTSDSSGLISGGTSIVAATGTRLPGHSSTSSVPFIPPWPNPQKFEQRNGKVPALSTLNSTLTVFPFSIFVLI
jgi:hypothetical protein